MRRKERARQIAEMRRKHIDTLRWAANMQRGVAAHVKKTEWRESEGALPAQYKDTRDMIAYDGAAYTLCAWMRKQKRKHNTQYMIVAGTRDIPAARARKLITKHWKKACRECGIKPTHLVSGVGGNVDVTAAKLAKKLTGKGPLVFRARWHTFGRSAGPIRNTLMAQEADALFLIWDGKSRGSADMLRTMNAHNKPVYELEI